MPTRAEYVAAQNGAVTLALRELRRLLRSMDPGDPVALSLALQDVWPDLIAQFGELTVTLAADRFEDLTGLPAVMVRAVDAERANARARWALTPLFSGQGDWTGRLDLILDELVKQPGRSTMIRSGAAHNIRFARVPTGAETCRWCRMLAGRGAVYSTASKAGEMRKFHGDCDCSVEPVRDDSDMERLSADGYDPEALYEAYLADS